MEGQGRLQYLGEVVVEPCLSLGTPQVVDQVLIHLAPEMGKETPDGQLKVTA